MNKQEYVLEFLHDIIEKIKANPYINEFEWNEKKEGTKHLTRIVKTINFELSLYEEDFDD